MPYVCVYVCGCVLCVYACAYNEYTHLNVLMIGDNAHHTVPDIVTDKVARDFDQLQNHIHIPKSTQEMHL